MTIKQIEVAIVDRAWDEGWVVPQPAAQQHGTQRRRDRRRAAAGLACAQQLARAGRATSTVYERDEAAGGLVRFGVPEFKIEKRLVERRVEQLAPKESSSCSASTSARRRRRRAARAPRRARARDRLARASRPAGAGSRARRRPLRDGVPLRTGSARGGAISAAGKHVVVIGGGDTGADCVGHAHREGAASVTQIELVGEPPVSRPDELTPWPLLADEAPHLVRAEGRRRARLRDLDDGLTGRTAGWSRSTGSRTAGAPPFDARAGHRRGAACRASCCSRWASSARRRRCSTRSASLATRARTWTRRATRPLSTASSPPATPGAGQSLIVWAINEGRQCAAAVDAWLGRCDDDASVSIAAARRGEYTCAHMKRTMNDVHDAPELRRRGDRGDHRHEVDAADRPRPLRRPAALHASSSTRVPGSARARSPSVSTCSSTRACSLRRSYPESPPRVEYELTEKGRALLPIIREMRKFGRSWMIPAPARRRATATR